MINKIEEQVLQLIDEINKLFLESYGIKKSASKKQTHKPGTTWKTSNGKYAAKNKAGETSYYSSIQAAQTAAAAYTDYTPPHNAGNPNTDYSPPKSETNESAPEGRGWEKTVKGMKKHKDISNPFALANWMKKKGYKPKSEAINPDKVGGVSPEDLDKRLAVLRAQQQAADPASKLARDLPQRIDNLEKARVRAYDKQFKTDKMK